ncbi:hypothetical protein ACYOEI_25540 [Singulisphaera rosea]
MPTHSKDLSLAEKNEAAFKLVAIAVLERARRTGTPVIVWEDGRVVAKPVEDCDVTPETPR